MTTGVEVVGADQLAASLDRLGDQLADLTPANQDAGQALLDRADPPLESGALAASGFLEATPVEVVVGYSAEYAGVVHNGWDARNITGQPWLTDTATQETDHLTDLYLDHVADLVDHVKGA